MSAEPLIAMVGILVAFGLMMLIYRAAYQYYKSRGPRSPQDR